MSDRLEMVDEGSKTILPSILQQTDPSSPSPAPSHPEPKADNTQNEPPLSIQVQGWRRVVLLIAIFTGLFLAFLDSTIVSVALPTIANDFHDYSRSTWVFTAYLLTYMAFGITITRLSDIFGRRSVEIMNFVIFLAFSLGCALSKSMLQLIVFRALQGVGGSGLFSMTMVIGLRALPPQKAPVIASVVGLLMVTAGVLGPVLSGAITQSTHGSTWRWIFYLNLPVGGTALGMLLLAWPRDKSQKSFTRKAVASVDVLGVVLLLAASILLIFAMQEGGAHIYPWASGIIIACFVVAGVSFVAFIAWQKFLSLHPNWPVKQIFPIGLAGQRVPGFAMLNALLIGFTFYIAVVQLPQRFQIVDGDSPVLAGVKLLPMMASSGIGSIVAGTVNSKRNMTPATLIVAAALQVLGYGLMITLGDAHPTPNRQFGFQVLLGFGFGASITATTIMGQRNVENRWIPVMQGALTQMRSLGGSLGLAVAVIVLNDQLRASAALKTLLSPAQLSALYKSPLVIAQLSPNEQAVVAQVFAKAFTEEMKVATYIAAATFIVSVLTWQRHPPPHSLEQAAAAMKAGPSLEQQTRSEPRDVVDEEKGSSV